MSANKLKDPLTDRLFAAIMLLKNEGECYKFFEDVCTVSELKSLSQRLEVARLLNSGSTYDVIVSQTGVSTATIARVKRCLDYGAGGYKTVLGRLESTIKTKGKNKDAKK